MIEPLCERCTKRTEFIPQDRREMNKTFSAGQSVLELPARSKSRRTRGDDLQLGKEIGTYLEHPAGVGELMDFIENYDRAVAVAEEQFRFGHHILCYGKVAVDVENPVCAKALDKSCLARPPHTGEPYHGRLFPGAFYAGGPERPLYYHAIILNINSDYLPSMIADEDSLRL